MRYSAFFWAALIAVESAPIVLRDLSNCDLPCNENSSCFLVDSSPECICNIGYYLQDDSFCNDSDECLSLTHNCNIRATCSNTNGSFDCGCKQGYKGDGVSCVNVNECELLTHNCDVRATCEDTWGSFSCTCNAVGFDGDGTTCSDISECNSATHTCHEDATCRNTAGSFYCECPPGFDGDGSDVCENVDECAAFVFDCDANARCEDTHGSFACICGAGYIGDGVECMRQECEYNSNECGEGRYCASDPGTGFPSCVNSLGEGENCTGDDVRECASRLCVNGTCEHNPCLGESCGSCLWPAESISNGDRDESPWCMWRLELASMDTYEFFCRGLHEIDGDSSVVLEMITDCPLSNDPPESTVTSSVSGSLAFGAGSGSGSGSGSGNGSGNGSGSGSGSGEITANGSG
eukprot:Rmarinus@m.19263